MGKTKSESVDLSDVGSNAVEAALTDNESNLLGEEERAALQEDLDETDVASGDAGDDADSDTVDSAGEEDDGAQDENADLDAASPDADAEEGDADADGAGQASDESADTDASGKSADVSEKAAVGDDDDSVQDEAAQEPVPASVAQPAQSVVGFLEPIPQETIDAAKAKADDAQQKFEDGDISHAEYEKEKDEYNRLVIQADLITAQNRANTDAQWKLDRQSYFGRFEELDKPMYHDAMAAEINWILDPKNTADNDMDMSNQQILELAHKRFEESNNYKLTPKGGAKQEPEPKAEPKPEPKKDVRRAAAQKKANTDRENITEDIGGLPTAGAADDSSKWDYLDSLEGDAFEAALAKLSPEEQNVYAERE